jgi:predicted transcriptional regulator
MPSLTDKDLTPAEKLALMRRRNGKHGRSIPQRTLSRTLKVTRRQIQLAEEGKTTIDEWPGPLQTFVRAFSDVKLNEICHILRRRSGRSIAALATELGLTRYWVQQMELGREKADRLVAHYGI